MRISLSCILLFACVSSCNFGQDEQVIVEQVRRLQQQKVESLNAGDFAAWLALHSDDVLLIPPGEDIVAGKDALRAWGEPYFQQFSMEDTESVDEIVITGDWSVLRYSYSARFMPKAGGEALSDSGRGMLLLQRQTDGTWRIARHIWNAAATE